MSEREPVATLRHRGGDVRHILSRDWRDTHRYVWSYCGMTFCCNCDDLDADQAKGAVCKTCLRAWRKAMEAKSNE